MGDLRAMLAYLDPGGPDEGPPRWWLDQWRQEADDAAPAVSSPAVDEGTVRRLEAYAAHRTQGRSPAEAAWEAELEMEAS